MLFASAEGQELQPLHHRNYLQGAHAAVPTVASDIRDAEHHRPEVAAGVRHCRYTVHRIFSSELVLNNIVELLLDAAEVFVLKYVVILIWRFLVHILKHIIVLRDGADDKHLSGYALMEL